MKKSVEALSRNIVYVGAGVEAGSKLDNARELNVPVWDEWQLLDYLLQFDNK